MLHATMASISTPVRAATRASQTSVTVPASASTVTDGSTWVSGSEWASGISSSVRLAAWIAASRATVATSPFGPPPAATRAAACGDIRTTARARAQRTVSAFSLTSTMRALPAASRWVSVPSTITYGTEGEDLGPLVRRAARARRLRPRRARPARGRARVRRPGGHGAAARPVHRGPGPRVRRRRRARAPGPGSGADPAGERRRGRRAARLGDGSAAGSQRGRGGGARPARGRGRVLRGRHARGRGARLRGLRRDGPRAARGHRRAGGRAARAVCGRARAPGRSRAAQRAVGDRRRLGAAPRGGLPRRPRADRPRESRGADLEGRAHRRRPAPRRGRAAVAELTLGEAARAIGVSADTLRRWDRAGKLRTVRDARNRRMVPEEEVERLAGRPQRHATGSELSARNRFPGV